MFGNTPILGWITGTGGGGGGGVTVPLYGKAVYVYLVGDPIDAAALGGTANNVYTNAQAAYNAAQVLSGPSFNPVVIIIGKTTAAQVGDIVITDNYGWNASVSLSGISAYESKIGNIILDNATGNVPGMGNFFASNVEILGISALATGPVGNGPTAMALELSGVNMPGGILMGTNNVANTAAFGGNLSISGYDSYSGNFIGDIVVTPGSAATWGSIDISTKGILGNIDISTGISGGNINLGGALQMQGLILTQTSATGTTVTVSDNVYINAVTVNVNGNNTLNFGACTLGGLSAATASGSLSITMGGTILLTQTSTTNAPIVAIKSSFTDITVSNNSRFYDCTFSGRILSIGTGCSIINSEILSTPQPSISNPTAVTVIGDGTYWRTAPQSTVTVTNAVSVIPTARYVWLVRDASDRIKMGDRHNNVYSTFQTAYDAANALQIALGGTNVVTIMVGNTGPTAAGGVGNLTLTANYNTRVAICGISKNFSILGNIVATNAAGNGFSVGDGVSRVAISNVTIGNIQTSATGATGNSGEIGINLNNASILQCQTNITNAANLTGNGGNVTFAGTNTVGPFTINTINTRTAAGATTAFAGNVAINSSTQPGHGSIGNILTANDSLGGDILVSNVQVISNITFIGAVGNTANINLTNIPQVGTIAATMDDNRTINITRCNTGNITVTNIGALATPINVNIITSTIGNYTSNDATGATLIMKNSHCTGSLSNLTNVSRISDCVIDGNITSIQPNVFNPNYLGLTIENTVVNTTGLTYAIDNEFPVPSYGLVYIKSRNNSFNGSLREVILTEIQDVSTIGVVNTLPGDPNFQWDMSKTEVIFLVCDNNVNYTLNIPPDWQGVKLGKRYTAFIRWTGVGSGGSFTLPAPRKTPNGTVYGPPALAAPRVDRLDFEYLGESFWYITPTLNYVQY